MSYQAIARKWRPQTFDEMVGQEAILHTLRNALTLKRIHHAYLFTGARGVGKTTAARALARCLNCDQGPSPSPCGVCGNCQDILQGTSPDVVEIDGASNNSVNDVRDLRDGVSYLPAKGSYRVYIVDEVHMLSSGAFNAFLKTLEEPPSHVVFIFATTEPQKIPDTVLSRVQRFDFKRIPLSLVTQRLQQICQEEEVELEEAGLQRIARAGQGSMRDAQSLLDQVIAFGGKKIEDAQVCEILGLVDRDLLYGMLSGILEGRAADCLKLVQQIHERGYSLADFTKELLEALRNATFLSLSADLDPYVELPAEEMKRLREMLSKMRGDKLEALSQLFQAMLTISESVARADSPRFVLEMSLARLARPLDLQPVDQLLQRLESVQRALARNWTPPDGSGGGGGGGQRRAVGETSIFSGVPQRSPQRPPPQLQLSVDNDSAFQALLDAWMEQLDQEEIPWDPQLVRDYAFFLRIAGGGLQVGFTNGVAMSQASEYLCRPVYLKMAQEHFPEIQSVLPLHVEDDMGRSNKSKREAAQVARVDALRQRFSEDPQLQRACAILGARLVAAKIPEKP